MAKSNKSQKFFTLVLMMLSLCTIYILPYLRYTYYTPLQEAMNLVGNNKAYGTLTSVYGIANVILYLPGGWIADRFDPKKLLVFSMVSTGILGIWMSTWPSYSTLLLIQVLFAFTTVLTYWSSSIKCVNMISDPDEQGSMFGSLEAGRNLISLLIVSVFLAIYAAFSSNNTVAMTWVVRCCSLLMIAVGVLLWFFMPKTSVKGATNEGIKESLRAMGHAFKWPVTYILAGLIFTASLCGSAASYFAPYLQNGAGLSVMVATTFANYRGVACGVVAALLAAYLSRKLGNSAKAIVYAGSVAIVCYVILALVPGSSALVWPILIIMLIASMCNYVYRALYYATIEEGGSPKNIVGSIIGIASLLGFLPDTFTGTLFGGFLDSYGLDGYRMIFGVCIAVSVMGVVCAILATRLIKKHRESTKDAPAADAEAE